MTYMQLRACVRACVRARACVCTCEFFLYVSVIYLNPYLSGVCPEYNRCVPEINLFNIVLVY